MMLHPRSIINALSLSRIGLALLFVVCYQRRAGLLYAPFALWVVALSTDLLDGYLARRWRVASSYGRYWDSMGDKSLYAAVIRFQRARLEGLSHEVIVADPNFAPMYATRSKKVKTDKRDAHTLCEVCQLGAYRPAHRTSDKQRRIRARLAVCDTLVRTRAKCMSLIGP
jgi:hypothetical protein